MDDQLVTLASYLNPLDAEMAKGMLESNGIEVFLLDAQTASMGWGYNWVVGGVKVQVRQSDLETARQLLQDATEL